MAFPFPLTTRFCSELLDSLPWPRQIPDKTSGTSLSGGADSQPHETGPASLATHIAEWQIQQNF